MKKSDAPMDLQDFLNFKCQLTTRNYKDETFKILEYFVIDYSERLMYISTE